MSPCRIIHHFLDFAKYIRKRFLNVREFSLLYYEQESNVNEKKGIKKKKTSFKIIYIKNDD